MSDIPPVDRPRYSTEPLPPYSYVPGFTPHPVSNPLGHMHGHRAETPAALDPARWEESAAYRYGVDLFNHGFYWEAHEAWESLWHAAGRSGPMAIWLKALIKLAAAAVKVREGNSAGAMRHARRSFELLQELLRTTSIELTYCGVNVCEVEMIAVAVVFEAELGLAEAAPSRVLDHWIRLPI
jgi:hypothetical protein